MERERTPGNCTSFADALITGELALRPARAPDHAAENQALATLAGELATRPRLSFYRRQHDVDPYLRRLRPPRPAMHGIRQRTGRACQKRRPGRV
jgi:hypothetical protein